MAKRTPREKSITCNCADIKEGYTDTFMDCRCGKQFYYELRVRGPWMGPMFKGRR